MPGACSAGFSGIIFALLVEDNHLRGIQYRSLYGWTNLPSAAFPWILLVLWQLLLPHISLFGHLGGLLAGTLYSKGYLNSIFPGPSTFMVSSLLLPDILVTEKMKACRANSGSAHGSLLAACGPEGDQTADISKTCKSLSIDAYLKYCLSSPDPMCADIYRGGNVYRPGRSIPSSACAADCRLL